MAIDAMTVSATVDHLDSLNATERNQLITFMSDEEICWIYIELKRRKEASGIYGEQRKAEAIADDRSWWADKMIPLAANNKIGMELKRNAIANWEV